MTLNRCKVRYTSRFALFNKWSLGIVDPPLRSLGGCITKLKLIAVLCVGRSYIELTLQPCLLSPVVLAAGSETAGCDYSVHTPLHPPASTRVRPPKVPPCQVPRLAAARAVPSALPQTFSIIHAHPSL